ncbi:hypothetical protein [uncultured Tenacibaculum sp.]|uniref:hypothetical protein n=1 Tax=uncultured Tenacibaculum sp. TaxID=174713 RepID=UPI002621FC31|nr:hypothetical protein [uncultured Tenacibaculum sp.]
MGARKLLFISFILFVSMLTAQVKNVDSLYVKYFENQREVPYVHLNKTSFFKGEEVWFKAYVLNLNTQKLHQNTSNLYCTLYDENGVYKDQKLLYVKDGVASGNFKIDSTYTSEKYYIKASTNFMRNFEEDESFLQELTIVDNKKQEKKKTVLKDEYDLQVLPEGGHLLANSYNTLGVILNSKSGRVPSVTKAELVSGDKSLLEFKFNRFGQAKIGMQIEVGKEYEIKTTLDNGQELRQKLPSKELKGVTLAFEDISSNMSKFIINTNPETIDDLAGDKYYILIHNTNSYLKRYIKFKPNTYTYSLFINKKLFKPGTNIVTLFSSANKPVAERVFFSHSKSLFSKLSMEATEITNDSLTISFSKKDTDVDDIFLSASFLPKETKSYNPDENIYTNFFIKPYIKGELKDVKDLFENPNRKKLRELDVLLLTQGWSKYNWNTIFYNTPKQQFKFEKGITIKGTINDVSAITDSTKIHLLTNSNELFIAQKLNKNKVEFKNLYVKDTATVNFSFSNKEILKKPYLYVQTFPGRKIGNIDVSITDDQGIYFEDEVQDLKSFVYEKQEVLNEVEVKGKLKIENTPVMFGMDKRAYKIDETYAPNQRILEFIRYNRFRVDENELNVEIKVSKPGLKLNPARVYVNGIEITFNRSDMLALRQMRLDEVDEVFTSYAGRGEIHIYTKPRVVERNVDEPFFTYKMPFGFSVEKEYYQPKYLSTGSKAFKDYGVVYWKPNIKVGKESYQFKIPKLDQNDITLFLEGISKDGKLISVKKTFTDLKKINN